MTQPNPQFSMTIQQALELGMKHFQAGQVAQAETLFRRVLAVQPNHPDALNLLGVVTIQRGQVDAAVHLFQRAIAAYPGAAHFHSNLGQALFNAGRPADAIPELRQAISLQNDIADCHCLLGKALRQTGRSAEAIDAFQAALALKSDDLEAFIGLGNALQKENRLDDAVSVLRMALERLPKAMEIYNNLGNALQRQGRLDEAIDIFNTARSLWPKVPELHNNLGALLQIQGRFEEAIAAFQRSIALRPAFAEAHNNLGSALRKAGRFDESVIALRQAMALRPAFADAINNLGIALRYQGHFQEATASFRQALEISPKFPEAHFNLGVILLMQGEFREGWPHYEWRRQMRETETGRREFSQQEWDGNPLDGRRILLHPEQGFGDLIHFCRYVSVVAAQGGRVILLCLPQMSRLLRSLPGVWQFVDDGQPLPEFDVHCPLLSLPMKLGTTLETIPVKAPYLQADPELARRWSERFAADRSDFRVGLAWAGSPQHANNRYRSIPFAMLQPLLEVKGIRYYSLQKGDAAGEARNARSTLEFVDWTDELRDFADTAALIQNLDLVISVDTAVAHLAGAMGKPVWLLLPFALDWRWLLDRDDSPWYPTVRLLRRKKDEGWERVIRQIVQELQSLQRKDG